MVCQRNLARREVKCFLNFISLYDLQSDGWNSTTWRPVRLVFCSYLTVLQLGRPRNPEGNLVLWISLIKKTP